MYVVLFDENHLSPFFFPFRLRNKNTSIHLLMPVENVNRAL
jgi:hypothetical protein